MDSPFALQQFYDLSDALRIDEFRRRIHPNHLFIPVVYEFLL